MPLSLAWTLKAVLIARLLPSRTRRTRLPATSAHALSLLTSTGLLISSAAEVRSFSFFNINAICNIICYFLQLIPSSSIVPSGTLLFNVPRSFSTVPCRGNPPWNIIALLSRNYSTASSLVSSAWTWSSSSTRSLLANTRPLPSYSRNMRK